MIAPIPYDVFDNFSDDFFEDDFYPKCDNQLALQGNMHDWGIKIPTSDHKKIRINYARVTIHHPDFDESFNVAGNNITTAAHTIIIPLPTVPSARKAQMRIRIEVFTRSFWIGISRKYIEYNFGLNMR
jgi:hypothetical protein